jgi:hypothetical protein
MSTTTPPHPGQPMSTLVGTTHSAHGGEHTHVRISWAAIAAGVILVIAMQLLLSMLGLGIGLGLVSPNTSGTPDASSFGIGAGLWWLVSSLAAVAMGGYVASWLGGLTNRFDGVLHGLVTWGIATLLTFYLLTSAVGGLIGGAFSVVGSGLSAAGSGISSVAPKVAQATGVTPDMLQQQAQAYLQPANPDPASMTPQDAQKEIVTALPKLASGGPDAAAAKERIITITAAQGHISRDEATQRFNDAQAKFNTAKDQTVQTAKNTADASAGAASKGSFLAFAVLLLGAIAAALGGKAAVQQRVMTTQRVVR